MAVSCFRQSYDAKCFYCKKNTTLKLIINSEAKPLAYVCEFCKGPHQLPTFPSIQEKENIKEINIKLASIADRCEKAVLTWDPEYVRYKDLKCENCGKLLHLNPGKYTEDWCRYCEETNKI